MKPKKIILIVIDTLRADHLGCYGYKRVTSPNIDKFEKECVLFRHAFSPSSYTVPSITSILTGKYPNSHCTEFSNGRPTKNIETDIFLTEVLSSENYETAGFISALVMGKDRRVAITSGFKEYNDRMTNSELNRLHELIRCGEDTNKDIFKWLHDNYTKDFFLFIHYFDVHGPYINPDNYNNIFVNDKYYGEPKIIDKIVTDNRAVGGIPEYQVLKSIRDKEGKLINFQKDLRYYIAQYDGGIKYCDDRVCDLLDLLKDLNIYDDCLIVLTSDHGESLGENDVYFFHGLTVTPDQICVPLMIKFHKGFDIDPKAIDVHVSLVDIMSTILDIVGFEYKNLYLQGESLLKLMKEKYDKTIEDRIIIAEIEGQIAYIDSKIINVKPKKVDKNNLVFFYIEELCNKEIKFNYKKDEKMLEWTGERYIPWMQNGEIHYEHLHRYALAYQFVKNKKVLDLACGEGYGSYMLSKNAESIIGIDLDGATVNHARNRYTAQNLEFMMGSVLEVPIKGKEEFDVIVCFEAIEHVEKHEKLLSEVKRLLKNDGLFIVSSPNKKTYSDEPNFVNPFHKKELYFGDFKDLLDKYFEESIFFGQKVYNGSNIWPLPPYSHSGYKEFVIERQDKEFDFSDTYKKSPQYFIAISSDKKLGQENFLSSNLLDISNVLVKDLQCQINDFEQRLQAKDAQVVELTNSLQTKDAQVVELTNSLQTKDAQVVELTNSLQAVHALIDILKTNLQENNIQINKLVSDLQSVRQSVTWKTVIKYQKIIDVLFPHETRRRRYYDLGLLSIRTIVNEGWRSFWWKVKYYARQKNPLNKKKTKIEKIVLPKDDPTEINDIIDIKVSIVIPTKNAGKEFEYGLNKIKNQKGLKEIELIIVDSGSSDETLDIARKYGAKLYQIKPEEFGHGKTRNFGARKVTGDFILFTTQDVVFAGRHLIYNIIKVLLNDNKIAAVTCRQIPRSNADLMASFQIWNHYKSLDINEDKITSVKDMNIAPEYKRKLANLSDSCCCIRKDLFLKYMFEIDFAEDLDLGIRLLKDKFKLAYLYRDAIIHSHNRNSSYFFKVSYTDSKVVSKMIGNDPLMWNTKDIISFYASIKKLYEKTVLAISIIEKENLKEPDNFIQTFETLLCSEILLKDKIANRIGEPTLDKLLGEIETIISYDVDSQADDNVYNFLLNGYLGILHEFSKYASNYSSVSPIKKDFIDTLYKLFSNSSGAALGNYVLFSYKEKLSDKKIEELDKFLMKGV